MGYSDYVLIVGAAGAFLSQLVGLRVNRIVMQGRDTPCQNSLNPSLLECSVAIELAQQLASEHESSPTYIEPFKERPPG